MNQTSLLIAGGGTGGHVLAGVAIADELQKGAPKSKVFFVGAIGGIEQILVPKAGYPLELLNMSSLKNVSLSAKIRTLFRLPLALFKAAIILLRLRPGVVLGVGGYASGPIVLMARILSPFIRCQVAILEQNAVPGLTNKILSYFAHSVFTAFPGLEKQFGSQAKKTEFSGNPVRSQILPMPSACREPFQIFVFGGSQGAVAINTLIIDTLPLISKKGFKIQWVHQTGAKDYQRVKQAYDQLGLTDARVDQFIFEMNQVYSASSLLVCRAGSSTLSEIARVGRAALLIPLPTAADDHQTKNAQLFADQGAAIMLRQDQCSAQDLAIKIEELIMSPHLIQEIETKVRKLDGPNAADFILKKLGLRQ